MCCAHRSSLAWPFVCNAVKRPWSEFPSRVEYGGQSMTKAATTSSISIKVHQAKSMMTLGHG